MSDPGRGAPRPAPPASRRTGALAAGLCVVLALLGAAAFAVLRPGAAPSGAPGEDAVGALLERRAAAVARGDRAAFLDTVTPALRAPEGRVFDNLRRMPLDAWRERFAGFGDVAPSGEASVRVTVRHRLRGFDRAETGRERTLRLTWHDGGWRVSGSGAGDDPEIWDGGPLRVVTGAASLVIGDAPEVAEISRRLDAAEPVVTSVTGRGWARTSVALAPARPAVARALAGSSSPDLTRIAALATVAPGVDGGRGADRVVVSPGTFTRLTATGRDVVLTHELTHVALDAARDTRTPMWLIEGLADHVGYKRANLGVREAAAELRADVRAGRVPSALPDAAAFSASSDRLTQAYQESWLACRMIARDHGEKILLHLYRTAGRTSESAALRSTLGLSLSRFTAQWRTELRRELG
ncbi:hypothetical protein [Actinomadura flavalba]|uniref:hypothetical protein n=1 Tax=Actinomadura flavalba TaxID=1120938 RepID=UPI00036B1C33|nr:hypothetical protein [Actinomadura flavalba]